jgi:hypothetical protein
MKQQQRCEYKAVLWARMTQAREKDHLLELSALSIKRP